MTGLGGVKYLIKETDMTVSKDEFLRETQELWDQKAQFWDELMGDEGNQFYKQLVEPTALKLLEVQSDEKILDVACGNGVFARKLVTLGAQVVATDYSAGLLERARTRAYADQIEYRQVDATNEVQLLELGEQRFDKAVCNMAFMDIPTLEPLLQSLTRLLKKNGRFVFTMTHPCFNTATTKMGVEQEDQAGVMVETYYLKVTNYLTPSVGKASGAPGEPNPHYYFDRSLRAILNSCFAAGFVLNGLEEPAFNKEATSKRLLSWANYPNIPPLLGGRLILTV
jgi:ubiquinone/menaquinone biosynthesis C-methylase UbiE